MSTLSAARGQAIGERDNQEDSVRLHIQDDTALAIVADGMGGHAAGEVASRAAADGFLAAWQAAPHHTVEQRLNAGLKAGNQAIADARRAGLGGIGMGCTLSALYADRVKVSWISVGDSPILLWTPGQRLRRLSEDHSMAAVLDEMARQGLMSREAAQQDPDRHALRSAVRGQEIELVDQDSAPWSPGSMLVVASDGLCVLSDAQIADSLALAEADPHRAVTDLLSAVAAARHPDQDNVSVVVVANPPALPPEPEPVARLTRWKLLALILGLGALFVAALAAALLHLGRTQ